MPTPASPAVVYRRLARHLEALAAGLDPGALRSDLLRGFAGHRTVPELRARLDELSAYASSTRDAALDSLSAANRAIQSAHDAVSMTDASAFLRLVSASAATATRADAALATLAAWRDRLHVLEAGARRPRRLLLAALRRAARLEVAGRADSRAAELSTVFDACAKADASGSPVRRARAGRRALTTFARLAGVRAPSVARRIPSTPTTRARPRRPRATRRAPSRASPATAAAASGDPEPAPRREGRPDLAHLRPIGGAR